MKCHYTVTLNLSCVVLLLAEQQSKSVSLFKWSITDYFMSCHLLWNMWSCLVSIEGIPLPLPITWGWCFTKIVTMTVFRCGTLLRKTDIIIVWLIIEVCDVSSCLLPCCFLSIKYEVWQNVILAFWRYSFISVTERSDDVPDIMSQT